jgi:hypothetical protein
MREALAIVAMAASATHVFAAPAPVTKQIGEPPLAPAVWYDFKGARLGMTVEEWKRLPSPAKPENLTRFGLPPQMITPICQGDPGADKLILFRTSGEKAAGVVLCQYAYPTSVGRSYQSWSTARVSIGQYTADQVIYKFLDGQLYEISITGHINLLTDIMDGLTAKFGDPTKVISDTTQNKMGATFPHTIKSWVNPVAMITVEAPWSRIDNLNVTYGTTEGMARIVAADRAANPAADKM